MKPLTIGQVARRAGVGVETVRFYERQGLLAEPARTPAGYRQYPAEVVARFRFIRRAKGLGFSLREVEGLLALRLDPGTTPGDLKRRALSKAADIAARIEDLRRTREALLQLADACPGQGPLGGGPILHALDPPVFPPWQPGSRERRC